MFGVLPEREIARRAGVSVHSVARFRDRMHLPRNPRSVAKPTRVAQRVPAGHPLREYQQFIGLVPDADLACRVNVEVGLVVQIRRELGLDEVSPIVHPAYYGPLIGFEPLLSQMSAVKVSRATGLPIGIIEARRDFLGIPPFVRFSKLDRYKHLIGRVSNYALAKYVGVSTTRVSEYRKQKSNQPHTSNVLGNTSTTSSDFTQQRVLSPA
ncbi:hypothetical protein GIV96_25510 [Pseudomonas syringae]|uniref:hypothetical protein n=1 Tax=Pseudomonas syringae TaxID=317 RepID=UPI001F2804E1|nr:hypothetical protein [Pseudomonas syringae]MCF5395312.1 hypothetical protein [Pseudomonas syringae]MCF5403336.1 hypothetical protein [Pseudomonas syringae]